MTSKGLGEMFEGDSVDMCAGKCGPMDKAPDFGSGDCRFESCRGRTFFSCLDTFYIQWCLFMIVFPLFIFFSKEE